MAAAGRGEPPHLRSTSEPPSLGPAPSAASTRAQVAPASLRDAGRSPHTQLAHAALPPHAAAGERNRGPGRRAQHRWCSPWREQAREKLLGKVPIKTMADREQVEWKASVQDPPS
ncbi:hypothetical protein NDU88_010538 [Pleurodeles waltl]|uniref:Uncharacterized protein n=1 Tax=Pleurodeles waltl TaxID=8319 RepID=A0AAV7QUP7_PLEWA|nr:hypothetical protein NDU88_010538 [Pleurodeles waltl]